MAGEYFNHLVAVRYRVTGSGTLQGRALSLDEVYNVTLPNVTLQSANANFPNLNTNFKQQKIQVEIFTDEFDDYFLLKQITLFMKPVAVGYPQ